MSSRLVRILPLCLLVSVGCVKQDTEILARVGQKLGENVQTSTAGLRDKLPFRLVSANAEPSPLAEQVRQRIAFDKLLAASDIDVQANGAEIELKGVVERDEQKRRALDLAETTQGVEKVVDSLQVRANGEPGA